MKRKLDWKRLAILSAVVFCAGVAEHAFKKSDALRKSLPIKVIGLIKPRFQAIACLFIETFPSMQGFPRYSPALLYVVVSCCNYTAYTDPTCTVLPVCQISAQYLLCNLSLVSTAPTTSDSCNSVLSRLPRRCLMT